MFIADYKLNEPNCNLPAEIGNQGAALAYLMS